MRRKNFVGLNFKLTHYPLTGIFDATNTKLYAVAADGSGNITGTMGASTNILAGFTVAPVAVPEPASLGLFGVGAAGLLLAGRRQRGA